MVLKFVNDTTRSIYAFEMLPPPAIDAPNDAVDQRFNSEDCVANNTVAVVPKSSSQPTDVLHTCDIVNDLLLCATASNRNQSPVPAGDAFCVDEGRDQLNNRMESSSSAPLGDVALLESNPDVNWQYNQLTDMATDDSLPEPGSTGFAVDGLWAASLLSSSEMGGGHSGDGEQSISSDAVTAEQAEATPSSQGDYKASADEGRQTEDGGGDAETSRVADEWKSCAICLEEMEDDLLLVHTECGGTLCPDCHGVCRDSLMWYHAAK